MKSVDTLMTEALLRHVFPGGVLLIAKEGAIRFFKSYGYANLFSKEKMSKETFFDLASLTKPLATTLAVIKLIQQSVISLDLKLTSVLPRFENTEKREITIRHLLSHNSGLSSYRPFYLQIEKIPLKMRKDTLMDLMSKEPMAYPTGKKVLYSDLGFIALGWMIEDILKQRLDRYVANEIYRFLGIGPGNKDRLFFVDLQEKFPQARFAATEFCQWRNFLVNGVVHDENAYALGGIAGHAGLFGTAGGVNILLSELLKAFNGYRSSPMFEKDLLHQFFQTDNNSDPALGFDRPSLSGA
ncbi:MAG: serine hydrolase domain-containing protein, partial [Nitrospinales bacterium]